MPAPPLASLLDLRVRIPGGIEAEDEARAEAALESASAWVRAEARQTWTLSGGELDPSVPDIAYVITLTVAQRVFDNPDALIQSSIDGASEAFANPTTDTYLTAGERAQLRRLRPAGGRGIGTLSTTRGTDDLETRVPVGGYAQPDDGSDPRGAKSMPWLGGDVLGDVYP